MESISNNKENALDVAKRLEWLSRAKTIVHKLDTQDSALLPTIVNLQKHLFEQTLILNKVKKIKPTPDQKDIENTWKRL